MAGGVSSSYELANLNLDAVDCGCMGKDEGIKNDANLQRLTFAARINASSSAVSLGSGTGAVCLARGGRLADGFSGGFDCVGGVD